ncbi:hypothetical protein LNN31_00120 [Acetobacterium wieringae]|uniref:EVE domain-containing protein n=1 Tax=Acetobacterium wieringae TaxID=52694 RepID=A0ABY6HF30_9FIRM|nr:hypothetical protein [Acetobacterium wieringae]UYO62895.1 hypothetical protein LNN31_00120 [Acetobacterium wieringae]VUZ26700.1 Uncharacterised protein [Acetobacterium wieringae]
MKDNRPSWFVSDFSDNKNNQMSQFITGGYWENQCSDQLGDLIDTIKVGDRIALKTTHNRKSRIPFETNGKLVSVMEITALGVVTGNYFNRKKIDVNWSALSKKKQWYFFTFVRSVCKVEPNPQNWISQALIDFTFYDQPQDYQRFLNEPYWQQRFHKEVTYRDEIVAILKDFKGEAQLSYIQEMILKRNKIKNLKTNPGWRAEVRFTLQKLSSDSKSFAKGEDLFYRKSFTSDVWGLREKVKPGTQSYSQEEFLAEFFMEKAKYEEISNQLKKEKSIILKQSPRVGRSFMVKKLAFSYLREKDENRVLYCELPQQENPRKQNNESASNECMLESWGFIDFCNQAIKDKQNSYYLIIDGINRENLNTIMPDLLLLFKRNSLKNEMDPKYKERRLLIPDNLNVIGMMDTRDRCLRLIEERLKQYFTFVELEPLFGNNTSKAGIPLTEIRNYGIVSSN